MDIWIKRVAGKFRIQQFSVGIILYVCFRSKIDTSKILTEDCGAFLWIFLCLAKIGVFPETWIIVNGAKCK